MANAPRHSRERGESSLGNSSNIHWKEIWKLPTPNKVKMFLWRCFHCAIAVLYNLNRKNIDISPYCPRCRSAPVTLEHLLFQCKISREVWRNSPFASALSPSWNSFSFMDWWSHILQSLCTNSDKDNLCALLAEICWFFGKGRNKTHFDGQVWPSSIILEKAMLLCDDYKQAADLKRHPPLVANPLTRQHGSHPRPMS